jgi:hypothetical protein
MGRRPGRADLRYLPTTPEHELVEGFVFLVLRLHIVP